MIKEYGSSFDAQPGLNKLELSKHKSEQELKKVLIESLLYSPSAFKNAMRQLDKLLDLNYTFLDRLKEVEDKILQAKNFLADYKGFDDDELEERQVERKKDLEEEEKKLLSLKNEILETQKITIGPDLENFIKVFALPKDLTLEDLETLKEISLEISRSLFNYERIGIYLEKPDEYIKVLLKEKAKLDYPISPEIKKSLLDEIFNHLFVDRKPRLSFQGFALIDISRMSAAGIKKENERLELVKLRSAKQIPAKQLNNSQPQYEEVPHVFEDETALLTTQEKDVGQLKETARLFDWSDVKPDPVEEMRAQKKLTPRQILALKNIQQSSKTGHLAHRRRHDTDASIKRTNEENGHSTYRNKGRKPKYKTEDEKRKLNI